MSNLINEAKISDSKDCPSFSAKPTLQKLVTHKAQVGGNVTVRRALPHRERRMIGAWCFFDHFGPVDLKSSGLNVAPHPHMGLQTFTWTIAGEILHRDSLGSKQIIKPGAVNLMTAGKGISHSEESLPDTTLHGVQLWIAMPDADRNNAPEFAHYAELPTFEQDNLFITILAGEFSNQQSPAKIYSPLMGLNLFAKKDVITTLPLNPIFEYGILVLTGGIELEGETIDLDTLLYLGCGREKITVKIPKDSHILMIGGEPFNEEVLLWWNFVARTRDEIIEATAEWESGSRFGAVKNYPGERLDAPNVPWIK